MNLISSSTKYFAGVGVLILILSLVWVSKDLDNCSIRGTYREDQKLVLNIQWDSLLRQQWYSKSATGKLLFFSDEAVVTIPFELSKDTIKLTLLLEDKKISVVDEKGSTITTIEKVQIDKFDGIGIVGHAILWIGSNNLDESDLYIATGKMTQKYRSLAKKYSEVRKNQKDT